MKRLVLLLGLLILSTSCQKEGGEVILEKLYYEYNPNQPLIIEFDVIPVGDVRVRFEDMEKEVNADYYNRYGIYIKLNLKSPVSVEDGPIRGCTSKYDLNRKVYIVDLDYVENMQYNIGGYACDAANFAVVLENYQTNRTLAHEIGHSLGLDHNEIENNVMRPYHMAGQYDIPNDFEDFQIDEILENIEYEKIQYEKQQENKRIYEEYINN